MSVSINEFWKLAVASGLLSAPRCKELHTAFAAMKGAAQQANTLSLAEWLVAGGALSRYQASLLVAGHPGPFVFGDFVVCDRIETGRLAHCYRATYKKTQTVLLVFAAQLTARGDPLDDIAEQTQAAMAIKNPHVNRVYHFVASEAHPLIVVQDLAGQSLREHLTSQKPTWDVACRIGFQAALGLVALHAQSIVHGSVFPENLWIDPTGTARLLQFPLVRGAADVKRLELPTADYLAPELANPAQAASALTDLYGLGCTLYELVAGRVPFPGGTVQQKLRRQQSEVPQRLDRLVPGVAEDVADLVAEMIDKEPLLRCQTASQVAHLLAPFASGSSPRAATPPRLDHNAPRPGYGVWQAPAWQSPPQQSADAAPRANPPAESATPRPAPGAVGSRTPGAQPKGEPPKPKHKTPADARPRQDATPNPSAAKAPQPIATPRKPSAAGPVVPPAETDGKPSAESPRPAQQPLTGSDAPANHVVSDAETPWEAPPGSVFSAGAGSKAPRDRFSNTALVGAGVGLALMAAIVIAGLLLNSSQDAEINSRPPVAETQIGEADAASADAASGDPTMPAMASDPAKPGRPAAKGPVTEVDDDGQTLWAAPPAGEPLVLNYLPSGAPMVMVLRPAELLASPEGAKLFDALGPAGELARRELTSILGVELTDVEQLTIAFLSDDAGAAQTVFVARLPSAIPEATLLERWSRPSAAEHKSKKFFQGPRYAYYLPAEGQGRVVVIASGSAIQEILELDGPPPLRKGIEKLLHATDSARQFNLLLAPSYLLTDGKDWLAGNLAKLRDPLAAFLDESIEAVLLSAQLGDELFLELRAQGSADKTAQALSELLRARLEKVADQVENYVASLRPQPYGRLVVMRFPRMVQLVSDYTRGGSEDRQAVLRCYLPGNAAHNLLLGAELALFEQPAAGPADEPPRETKQRPSAAAALRKKISLSFPRDTLERCLDMLSKEIDTEVVILGPDLQLEGITKNQSFGLDERDQPAGEILQKVLKLANSQGKLVYVIRPHGEAEAIFITTRNAAAKRGETIPAELDPKTSAEKS